jgi:hypothetical protein
MSRQADIHLGSDLLPPTGAVTRPDETTSAPARRDRRRLLLVAAMVASPVLMTAFQLLNPTVLPREEAGEYLAGIAAHPDRFVAAMTCYMLAMVTAVAGAGGTLLLTRHRARLVGLAGAVFTVIGVAAALATAGMQVGALGLVADGQVLPYGAEAFTRFQQGPGFILVVEPVAAAIIGFLCTAIALRRSRAVPLWVPVALFGGLVAGSNEFGWAVTVLGTVVQVVATVMVGRAVLRVQP